MASQRELIGKIKKKKDLSGVSEILVSDLLENFAERKKISLSNLSEKEEKIVIKEIRAALRNFTGRFQKNFKKRNKLLAEKNFSELLKTHSSTSERLSFYPKLKSLISSLNVNSILDLGCGLNPLALASPKYVYHASDIKEDELEIIREFFREKKISGEVFFHDIRKTSEKLPKADLCIIFKVLDILNDKKLSEKILEKIPCKNFLISFSTKKLSGKKMNFPRRIWFEKILEKKECSYKKFESENEVFYLIEKSSGLEK